MASLLQGGRKKTAPKGHFVVYVGDEQRRFVVPLCYLKNPIFRELLDKAADEYGFDTGHKGIVLPCDESTFKYLLDKVISVDLKV